MDIYTRKNITFFLKIATVFSSLGGVILSLIFAKKDGYFHWGKRLLYFTAQSNLWICFIFLALLLFPKYNKQLYLSKYAFTVSITLTGLVFCSLLAPFSDESYHPWTLPNLLTHVFTPLFAIADFFLDKRYPLSNKAVFVAILPPLFYFIEVLILEILHVDFGRGTEYPYFFFHYRSPAGIFGFSSTSPFFIGSFYWLFTLLIITLGLGFFYAKIKNKKGKKRIR